MLVVYECIVCDRYWNANCPLNIVETLPIACAQYIGLQSVLRAWIGISFLNVCRKGWNVKRLKNPSQPREKRGIL